MATESTKTTETQTTAAASVAETKAAVVVTEDTSSATAKVAEIPAAPANLFSKAAENAAASVANPTRVKIILAQIDDYVKSNGKTLSDATAARNGAIGLFQAIKLLVTLTGSDLTTVVDHLIKAIAADKADAFAETFIFRHVNALGTSQERENFTRLMNLFIQYGKLTNRGSIRKFADLDYSVALVAQPLTRKQLIAYFPK